MKTHDQLIMRLMRRPGVRAEVQRIEREAAELLDRLLKSRQETGLTQAQVAKRVGTQRRSLRALSARWQPRNTPRPSPRSRKYVKACGKQLVLRVA